MDSNRFYERINKIDDIDNFAKIVCDEYNLGDYKNIKIIEIGYEDFNAIITTSLGKYFLKIYRNERSYTDVQFSDGDYILFGKESAGIPEEILVENRENCIRIPMGHDIRSLNLANSVAIILYEALRQNNFMDLESEGKLHRLEWKND